MAFAIKDAIDLVLTKTGESTQHCRIDYLNDCQIQLESEQVFATKKGNNAISFSGGRSGTFTMNAEVIDINFLALMLGGKLSSNKIEVTGDIPSQSFKGEGTFRVVDEQGVVTTKKITFYKLQVQTSADLTLSASDVSSFSLVMDILADDAGKILDIEDTATGVSVDEPRVED